MIQTVPSMLSLIAAGAYAVVAAACVAALSSAIGTQQMPWHRLAWTGLAAIFIALAAMRVIALEDLVREELRLLLRSEGAYDDRRTLQGLIFAVLFSAAAFAGAFWGFRIARTIRGRRNIVTVVALAACCVLTLLILLRIVSLHSVDALLYGPLKLNWIIDLGTSAVVLVCAVQYRRVVTGAA